MFACGQNDLIELTMTERLVIWALATVVLLTVCGFSIMWLRLHTLKNLFICLCVYYLLVTLLVVCTRMPQHMDTGLKTTLENCFSPSIIWSPWD